MQMHVQRLYGPWRLSAPLRVNCSDGLSQLELHYVLRSLLPLGP